MLAAECDDNWYGVDGEAHTVCAAGLNPCPEGGRGVLTGVATEAREFGRESVQPVAASISNVECAKSKSKASGPKNEVSLGPDGDEVNEVTTEELLE